MIIIKLQELLGLNLGSRVRSNFIAAFRANVISQTIPLLISPFMTRLYGPADYGSFTLVASVISIICSFSILRLDWLLPNTSDENELESLFVFGFIFSCLLSILLFLICICDPFSLLSMVFPGVGVKYFYFAPAIVLFTSISNLFTGVYIKRGQLKDLSSSKIHNSFVQPSLNLLCGFFNAGAWGLLFSSMIGGMFFVISLARKNLLFLSHLRKVKSSNIKITFHRFQVDAFWSSLVSIINSLGTLTTPVLMSVYFSTVELGFYSLANRLALAPISSITSSIAQSFWAESALLVKTNPRELKRVYLKYTSRLAMIALVLVTLLLFAARFIGLIFGSRWNSAGNILVSILPQVTGQITFSPLSHLAVHGKQRWQFYWDLVRLLGVFFIIIKLSSMNVPLVQTLFYSSFFVLLMYLIVFCLNLASLKNAITDFYEK